MSKRKPSDDAASPTEPRQGFPTAQDDEEFRGWRETIESIVVAIILALLFRTFEAEAFVIPTGSMATTLMGRHKDVHCEKCGRWYQMGATEDIEDPKKRAGRIDDTVCPSCGFPQHLEPETRLDEGSFTGDRILVNKFAYALGEPQRWDVFVFRYPGNAKQNYIKRLVGLPNENVRIFHGDIYTQKLEEGAPFILERKPPDKVLAMLQPVHDTQFLPAEMTAAGLPSRWQPATLSGAAAMNGWQIADEGHRFVCEAQGTDVAWLRYRHRMPTQADWVAFADNKVVAPDQVEGKLITDFSAYNVAAVTSLQPPNTIDELIDDRMGLHWVGDLAVEATVNLKSATGAIWLECVEGGRHYRCRIDAQSGQAKLSIDDGAQLFDVDAGGENGKKFRTAETSVRGAGTYRLRLANVDDQLILWVNDYPVAFDASTTFTTPDDLRPQTSDADAGDLQPLAIGCEGASLEVTDLRVLRDIYYLALDRGNYYSEYDSSLIASEDFDRLRQEKYERLPNHRLALDRWQRAVLAVLNDPSTWNTTSVWKARRSVEFTLKEDEFFPLGDNSAQSQDARVWYNRRGWSENFVRREMLIGKAFVVYWPHGWHSLRLALPVFSNGGMSWEPVPLYPNWRRMGRIR